MKENANVTNISVVIRGEESILIQEETYRMGGTSPVYDYTLTVNSNESDLFEFDVSLDAIHQVDFKSGLWLTEKTQIRYYENDHTGYKYILKGTETLPCIFNTTEFRKIAYPGVQV